VATRRRRTTGTSRSTSTRRRSTTTRRRTTAYPRRRRKSTAATFGGAFGLVLVWIALQAPWWLKILALVVALVAVAGYVVITRRGVADDADPQADPAAPHTPGEPPQ
jgi:Flp pilus assembly protein TadB